ncbi:MAG TPA: hypothetical protein PKD90_06015 [Phnomibacter sp.]|nr:hypothetical protein [Phnomibacter sp.]
MSQPTNPPEWASFFTAEEYQLFISLVKDWFIQNNADASFVDGEVLATYPNESKTTLGLMNLAQMCKMTEAENWQDVINHHFEGIRQNQLFEAEFEEQVHNFDYAAPYLAVRLYSKEYATTLPPGRTIGKYLADDLYAMLVFDLPYSVRNVMPEEAANWHKSEEFLFELGIANVHGKYPPQVRQDEAGGVIINAVVTDHFFAPNIALRLAYEPGLVGTHGTLIGFPHRHTTLMYPIDNTNVFEALRILIPTIVGMHKAGPGSISNQLYWYNHQKLVKIGFTIEDQSIQLNPPEEFVQMLNRLEDPTEN